MEAASNWLVEIEPQERELVLCETHLAVLEEIGIRFKTTMLKKIRRSATDCVCCLCAAQSGLYDQVL